MIIVSKPDSDCIANELLRRFVGAKSLQIKSRETGTLLPYKSRKSEDRSPMIISETVSVLLISGMIIGLRSSDFGL